MATIILTTTADPHRVGLTFKIKLHDESVGDWFETRPLLAAKAYAYSMLNTRSMTFDGANTSVTIFWDEAGRAASMYLLSLRYEDLRYILSRVDTEFADRDGSPGRPEKKVLVATTTKERRLNAPTARSAY